MPNPFEHALHQLERAFVLCSFDEDFKTLLRHPNREIMISIPVHMDNGTLRVFRGYRVQYNNARGPYKGGIRYHHETDIYEVRALSFWMALKCAVANIPLGGGKGGIEVNPKELSLLEREQLTRGWTRGMAEVIGPEKDIPAPDVGTTSLEMDWIADEYAKLTVHEKPKAVVTGKSIAAGGSLGRDTATADGGFMIFKALQEQLGLGQKFQVVVQGCGNAGRRMAELFFEHGHEVVAISDSHGGIYKAGGLPIEAVMRHKDATGSVYGFEGAQNISNEALLELPCDLLVPAALENQITKENADRVCAKYIIELANGPLTPEADDILFQKGILFVPDILANAGGVTVSFFEWEQNIKEEVWTQEEVKEKLQEKMSSAFAAVWEKKQVLECDLRQAAFVVALQRIQEAMK